MARSRDSRRKKMDTGYPWDTEHPRDTLTRSQRFKEAGLGGDMDMRRRANDGFDNEQLKRLRAKKRRQRARRRKLIAILALLAILATGFIFAYHMFSSNIYKDAEGFQDYANEQLNDMKAVDKPDNAVTDYDYNSKVSYAIQYNEQNGDEISELMKDELSDLKKTYKMKIEAEEKTRQNEAEKGRYSALIRAILIKSAIYESDNGTTSFVIFSRQCVEDGKDMAMRDEKVSTYLFSTEKMGGIDTLQTMNVDYKEKASEYVYDYIDKKIDEDQLAENWQSYVAPTGDNYEKFVMGKKEVIFYFDQGTVQKKEYGVTAIKVPNMVMGTSIRSAVQDRFIDPEKPMVAITYDDGPGGDAEADILDTLEKNSAVATFFYLGNRVSTYPSLVQRAYDIGCEIGNHSWSHPDLTTLKKKDIKKQVKKTNDAVKEIIGSNATAFRPPYGAVTDKVTNNVEMPMYLWTVDTLDWKTRSPKKIMKVIKKEKSLDGKIILMHSIYPESAKATKKLITYLRKNGYQTVTVTELVKYKTGNPPKAGEVYRSLKN